MKNEKERVRVYLVVCVCVNLCVCVCVSVCQWILSRNIQRNRLAQILFGALKLWLWRSKLQGSFTRLASFSWSQIFAYNGLFSMLFCFKMYRKMVYYVFTKLNFKRGIALYLQKKDRIFFQNGDFFFSFLIAINVYFNGIHISILLYDFCEKFLHSRKKMLFCKI